MHNTNDKLKDDEDAKEIFALYEAQRAIYESAKQWNVPIDRMFDPEVIECLGPIAFCMKNLRAAADQWQMRPMFLLSVLLSNALEYERHVPGLIERQMRRKVKQQNSADQIRVQIAAMSKDGRFDNDA